MRRLAFSVLGLGALSALAVSIRVFGPCLSLPAQSAHDAITVLHFLASVLGGVAIYELAECLGLWSWAKENLPLCVRRQVSLINR